MGDKDINRHQEGVSHLGFPPGPGLIFIWGSTLSQMSNEERSNFCRTIFATRAHKGESGGDNSWHQLKELLREKQPVEWKQSCAESQRTGCMAWSPTY